MISVAVSNATEISAGAAMDEREKTLKEILEGLDGLVMLTQWELSLAEELRRKMEYLTTGGVQGLEGGESPGPGGKTP